MHQIIVLIRRNKKSYELKKLAKEKKKNYIIITKIFINKN